MADDVTGGVHAVDDVGELRIGGIAVGVLTVVLRPHPGVEELEAGGGGDHGVAAVADRVQPVEALDLLVGDDVQGVRVQGQDAAVVGGEDAWLCGVDGLGLGGVVVFPGGGGCGGGAGGGAVVAVTAAGEKKGGGGERRRHGRDRATAGTGGTVHGGISLRKSVDEVGMSTAA